MSKEFESEKNSEQQFTLDELRSLLEMLEKHDVCEFSLERGEEKLFLKRRKQIEHFRSTNSTGQPVAAAVDIAAPAAETETAAAPVSKKTASVISPMVGTFYRRPAVDAEPYVQVGDAVKKGDVLCIIEAMKLMNEIESDVSGRIAEICLEDGQMAEYGETLFKIETV